MNGFVANLKSCVVPASMNLLHAFENSSRLEDPFFHPLSRYLICVDVNYERGGMFIYQRDEH